MNIAITGLGILSCHGFGIEAFKTALQNGESYFQKQLQFSMLSFPVISAALTFFDFEDALLRFANKELINKIRIVGRRAPLIIQTSLCTALEALTQAELLDRLKNPSRIGLIVAGQNTTQQYNYQLHKQFGETLHYLPPSYALHF